MTAELPKTLLEMAGAPTHAPAPDAACFVLIDYQNEYLEGPLALPGAAPAVEAAGALLAKARSAGAPIFHIAHAGKPGSLFDRAAPRGRIIDRLAPIDGEQVIEKPLPNAFAHTTLAEAIAETGRRELVIAGFMTHMCVSATARAALDLGYRSAIDADACATRPLPDGQGGVIDAESLHRASLAALSDRFAVILRGGYAA